ncbi:MAG: methionine--tRNA ligase [Actinobacteria bacterium]|nr:methionine--tRNA ligase [Actinomycetota bacterium]
MTEAKAFYVTTPIYYVNDAPHIGHAYTTMVGDVLTRWHRMRGESVWYLTGTDEHGQKVEAAAAANGVAPQAWVDKLVADKWLPVLQTIDVANDDFIRTTEPRHTDRVQRFMERMHEQGWFYLGSYEGPYCVGCEEFKLPDDLVDGEGENAGKKCCAIHSRPVQTLDESNWFFKLSEFRDRLIAHYESNPQALQPQSAYNEVMSFLRGELKDLSISRSTFDWGIPLPWDPAHVIYVWFDALLNYATAVGLGDTDEPGARKFARTWPADVHLVGKDILRFHAVIWPAMLMAAGLPLPKTVFAHGWLLVGGEKMSKSKLTGIAPSQIVDTFGSDAFRYYFLRAIAFGSDGSFSWEDMAARYTNELANGLGNLASRATAMVDRYFGGVLPPADPHEPEVQLANHWRATTAAADAAVDRFEFATALAATKEFVDALNLYLTEQEPWKTAKAQTDDAMHRVGTVLNTVCEGLRGLCVLLHPVMPKATQALWRDLGAQNALGPLDEQRIDRAGQWPVLPAGTTVTKGEVLFPRLADEE